MLVVLGKKRSAETSKLQVNIKITKKASSIMHCIKNEVFHYGFGHIY